MLPNSLLTRQLIARVDVGRPLLFDTITLAIGIDAFDPEVFAVLTHGTLPTTFCLAMPTRFTGVRNSMLITIFRCSRRRQYIAVPAQSRYRNLLGWWLYSCVIW